MTRPTARVLALLELLQAGGRHTVSSLAERLGVDERTLRRYASHLIELGIPLEVTRGRYGGYRLAPGFKLPPLMFSDDEAVAVVLGLTGSAADSPAAESAAAKIRRVLPTVLASRIDALTTTMNLTSPGRHRPAPDTMALLALADGAQRHRTVRLAYTAWRGNESTRELDPYGLVFHSGRWYVTGWDHSKGQTRTFRIDRVRSVEATEATFVPPRDFDAVGHVLSGLAEVPYKHAVSVILDLDPAVARRRIPRSVGSLTELTTGVRLQMRAERLDGAAAMLAGLGCPFTVEAPDELRDHIETLARALLDAAVRSPTAERCVH